MFTRALLAVALLSLANSCDPEPAPLTFVAQNPWAAAQPTAWGRAIHAVEIEGASVYVGYGDWNANAGPVVVASWSADAWHEYLTAATEAVESFDPIGGRMWVPYTDPTGQPNVAPDYAADGPWAEAATGHELWHAFQVVEHDGSLFMIGTHGAAYGGLVVRSDDGGETWAESLSLPTGPIFPTPIGGELYVQGAGQSYRYDDGAWVLGPAYLASNGWLTSSVDLGARGIAVSRSEVAGTLFVYDEAGYITQTPGFVAVDRDDASGIVYGIRLAGGVPSLWTTTDGEAWTQLAVDLPASVTAFDVDGGMVWLGDASSGLWVVGVT